MPFTLRDAFRLGFVGYMFNFVSLGNVGGDLFKAIFLAREQTGRRAEAVASVMADRIIGLYALFLLASAVMFGFGRFNSPTEEMSVICQATLVGTLVGTLGTGACCCGRISPKASSRPRCDRLPRVGPTADKLLGAVRIYRGKPGVLAAALVMSLAVHTIATIGFYLIACGLPGNSPDLADHFIIVPLSMVAGALPLPLNGLGAFEGVVDFLYRNVPESLVVLKGQGLIVSIGYRAITIAIAMVGVWFYLGQRRESATHAGAVATSRAAKDGSETEGQFAALAVRPQGIDWTGSPSTRIRPPTRTSGGAVLSSSWLPVTRVCDQASVRSWASPLLPKQRADQVDLRRAGHGQAGAAVAAADDILQPAVSHAVEGVDAVELKALHGQVRDHHPVNVVERDAGLKSGIGQAVVARQLAGFDSEVDPAGVQAPLQRRQFGQPAIDVGHAAHQRLAVEKQLLKGHAWRPEPEHRPVERFPSLDGHWL